jgi:hypothetical protein
VQKLTELIEAKGNECKQPGKIFCPEIGWQQGN